MSNPAPVNIVEQRNTVGMEPESRQRLGHPAKFSTPILEALAEVAPNGHVLDPFAGVGGIHRLASPQRQTWGIELEPEWAQLHQRTVTGDCVDPATYQSLPCQGEAGWWDAIVTSPTYGNRMADHHNATDGSHRSTYRHMLGRALSANSSAGMQWGPGYRAFHTQVWAFLTDRVRDGGLFILNISDHVRAGELQPVVAWHIHQLQGLDWQVTDMLPIVTARNRYGANAQARANAEQVVVMAKGSTLSDP